MSLSTRHYPLGTRRQPFDQAQGTRHPASGFGLLEVVLSAGILATVLGASVSLMNSSLRRATLASERTTAMNLAQEGVELVRAARDTALVDQVPNTWNSLFDPAGGAGGASDSYVLAYTPSTSGGAWKLAQTGTGTETIQLGTGTYERTISVTPPGIDYPTVAGLGTGVTENDVIRKITVTVKWGSKTAKETVTSIIYLTNWQGS